MVVGKPEVIDKFLVNALTFHCGTGSDLASLPIYRDLFELIVLKFVTI